VTQPACLPRPPFAESAPFPAIMGSQYRAGGGRHVRGHRRCPEVTHWHINPGVTQGPVPRRSRHHRPYSALYRQHHPVLVGKAMQHVIDRFDPVRVDHRCGDVVISQVVRRRRVLRPAGPARPGGRPCPIRRRARRRRPPVVPARPRTNVTPHRCSATSISNRSKQRFEKLASTATTECSPPAASPTAQLTPCCSAMPTSKTLPG
jgi:hypothetical protein